MSAEQAKPIHPTEIAPQTVIASSKPRGWSGLVAEQHLMPPVEFELPPLNEHLIVFHLDSTPANKKLRQISRFDGREFDAPLTRGDVIILPANIPSYHTWTTIDEFIMLSVEPELLRRTALETNETNPDRIELISTPQARDANIQNIALLLKNEIENENLGGRIYGESLATILALHLLRTHCVFESRPRQHKGGLSPSKLQLTTEFIIAHLSEDLSLETLAALCGLSLYHFARMFKQSTGLAPHHFVLRQRIERAKRLLSETELQIVEIALHTGFGSQSHLSNVFRGLVGTTPAAYRASFK